MNLIKYGIYEEKSNIRAHISDRIIYICQTENIIKAIDAVNPKGVYAYQPGYNKATAWGYLLPIESINDLRKLKYISWAGWDKWDEKWSTTNKGVWAVNCIVDLLKLGRFPFWIKAKQTEDTKIDIEGTDILVYMDQRIQVKCDFPARRTGNLYIQTHESNPYKMY